MAAVAAPRSDRLVSIVRVAPGSAPQAMRVSYGFQ